MRKPVHVTMGLDLSLASSGLALIENGRVTLTTAIQYKPVRADMVKTASGKSDTLSDRQKIERLDWISTQIRNFASVARAKEKPVNSVAIEGYAFSRQSASVTGLAELGGVVRVMCMNQLRIIPMTLTVQQCRQFVIGHGKVKGKGAAAKKVIRTWLKSIGLEFETDDEGDAFIVGLTGFYVANPTRRHTLTLQQLEVIDAITAKTKRRESNP